MNPRLAAIRTRLSEIATEMEPLATAEELTDEQSTRFAELDTESQALEAEATGIEAREQRLESVRSRVAGLPELTVERTDDDLESDPIGEPGSIASGTDRRGRNPWREPETRNVGELRGRARAAAERMAGASDSVRQTLTRFVDAMDTIAEDDPAAPEVRATLEQIVASSDPEYMRAFRKLVVLRQPESALTDSERRAYVRTMPFVRAMSTTDANGGFLIPQQLDPNLILTANGSVNPIRNLARKVIATGDRWDGVSAGAASWSWDAEGTEVSDDAVTVGNPNVPVYTARGFIPYSHEVGADAANWAANMGLVLSQGKDDLEATAFATGSGTGQPTGIVTALTGTSSVVASTTADTYAVGDVYKVFDDLPARYRTRAAWIMAAQIISLTRQFGTADSHALLTRLADGHEGLQLLGKSLLEASALDSSITAAADNYITVVGDWSNYVVADRLGMVVEVIPHLFGANGRPTGQAGLYARYRVGADSVNDGGFRMLNVT